MAEETEKLEQEGAAGGVEEEPLEADKSRAGRARLREIFRQAFDKARREQQPVASRRELGRDRSRSLFLLLGAAVAILLLFLGVFSSPNKEKKSDETRRAGAPNLGRKVTPGQEEAQSGSVTPLLNADTASNVTPLSQDVTPEDVSKTARPSQPSERTKPKGTNPEQYALGRIDFSDPALAQQPGYGTPAPQPPAANSTPSHPEVEELRKPSLVFVRAAQNDAPVNPPVTTFMTNQSPSVMNLPAGTRLVARLLSPISTAVQTPVVAAIEYTYERDGEVLVPAGAKAIGTLQQADRSGEVGIHFDTLQMPDGSTEKIDATGMGLDYGPIRGNVGGKRTGTRFLVRALSGIGTVATYLVGAGGGNGLNGPLSESALLRERIATNIGMTADQELNRLALNQNIVVTVPGNTRFYLVLQKTAGVAESRSAGTTARETNTTKLPSIEELRELMQLKRELSEMVRQSAGQSQIQQTPQP